MFMYIHYYNDYGYTNYSNKISHIFILYKSLNFYNIRFDLHLIMYNNNHGNI